MFRLRASQRLAFATSVVLLAGCSGGSSPAGPATAKPTPTPGPTLGPVDVSTNDLQFTSVSGPSATMSFTISQATPSAGRVSVAQTSCADGAAISFTPSSGPSNATTSISVTALSPPSGTPAHACTLVVYGSGGELANVYVDIRAVTGVLE